jgi:amino acid adenylation domain-containing protein
MASALARPAPVVARHEALRTRFPAVGGEPVQVVDEAADWTVEFADLSGYGQQREEAAWRAADEEAATMFDLGAGPLLRVRLLRLAREDHLLIITMHHIISDGWSISLLLSEFAALYAADGDPAAAGLPMLEVQYRDFAVWQRRILDDQALAGQLDYWRDHLEGAPRELNLPTVRPRPQYQHFSGGSVVRALSADDREALRELCQRHEVTTFMAFLAALGVVLRRWSGQDQLVIGVPIVTRSRAELEPLIGFFMNTLALRLDLAANPTFAQVLAQARDVALGAYAHQDYPFEKLVDELDVKRDLSRTPLFQVMLNVVNVEPSGLKIPGLSVEEVDEVTAATSATKFDLTLYVHEGSDDTRLELSYRDDLYDRELMRALVDQVWTLLRRAARDADRTILGFALGDQDPPPPVRSVPGQSLIQDRFLAQVRHDPDRVAVVDRAGTWTYRQLDDEACRVASRLRGAGVSGGVVGVVGRRTAGLVATLLGLLKEGVAFAVIDPAYPEGRTRAMLARADARALVDPEREDLLAWTAPATGGATVSLATREHGGTAYVMFTSGSTGEPQPVLGGHGPVVRFIDWHARRFGLGRDDDFAMLSGLSYDPLIRDVFTPLSIGATLHIPDGATMADPGSLARWLGEHRITTVHTTPGMLRLMADVAGTAGLPALRRVFTGGDALRGRDVLGLRRIAPAAQCVSYYGTTETPQGMAYFEVPDGWPGDGWERQAPIGTGVDWVHLLVATSTGEPAEIGEIGELLVRTPYLSFGYLNNPALTAQRFIPDPYQAGARLYRTGDLARRLSDGTIEFLGRADQQLKVRGHRIELGDVEAALHRHPAVRAGVVTTVEGATGDVQLAAYVVRAHPEDLADVAELRGWLSGRLPDHMVPASYMAIDQIPLTPNGKPDRAALPLPDTAGRPGLETPYTAPATPLEFALADIWSAVLGRHPIGVHDDFFALGGHSLLVTQVIARIRMSLGLEIPVRVVFEKTTISAQAAALFELLLQDEAALDIIAELDQLSDEEVRAQLRAADPAIEE